MSDNGEGQAKVEKCVLHIGVPKTGSTSIQASLKNGADILAAAGVLYPVSEHNHRFLVSAFMQEPDNFDYNRMNGRTGKATKEHNAETLSAFDAEVAKGSYKTVILSAEHMVLLKPPEIAKLKTFLDHRFDATQVLMYQRDPIQQSVSIIQERVKNGKSRLSACLADPPTSNCKSLIKRWVMAYGSEAVTICPYTGDLPGKPDIVKDFLKQIGLGLLSDQIESVRRNDSLSGAGLLIADALMDFAPKFERKRSIQRQLPRIAGPKYLIPAETLAKIIDKTADDRAYLADIFGISYTDPVPPSETFKNSDYFNEDAIQSLARILHDLS